jgi:hypothetical protein
MLLFLTKVSLRPNSSTRWPCHSPTDRDHCLFTTSDTTYATSLVFLRQCFGIIGPYDTISPSIRILLSSATHPTEPEEGGRPRATTSHSERHGRAAP